MIIPVATTTAYTDINRDAYQYTAIWGAEWTDRCRWSMAGWNRPRRVIDFEIIGGAISSLTVRYVFADCESNSPISMYFGTPVYLIVDNTFAIGDSLLSITGWLTSSDAAVGIAEVVSLSPLCPEPLTIK